MQNKINRRTLFKLSGLVPALAVSPTVYFSIAAPPLPPVVEPPQVVEAVEPFLVPQSHLLFTNGFEVTWLDSEVVVSPGDVAVFLRSEGRQFHHQTATTLRFPLLAHGGDMQVRLVANWEAMTIRVEAGRKWSLDTMPRKAAELIAVLGEKRLPWVGI